MKKILLLIQVVVLISCKKFVEIASPEGLLLSSNVFTDDVKANSAVSAVYGNMINGSPGFSNFLTTVYGGMSSDELSRYNPSLVFQEFINNSLSPNNAQVRNIWTTSYKNIYYCNIIIEGLQASSQITSATKKQLSAECKVLRAMSYFYLLNLFGDVPLTTTTDFSINSKLARSPMDNVYKVILDDLLEAQASLTIEYPNNEKIRVNKWVATALIARVYLYKKDWKNAELNSDLIISSNTFTPLQSLQSVFLKNSKEAIWQLSPINGLLQETRQMRPSGSTPQVYMQSSIMNSFENGDLRRTRWLDSVTIQSTKYYYPGKYKNTSSTVTEYYMVFRVGEQYLIRAEAKAQQDNLKGAIDDLNVIRVRAGLPLLSSNLTKLQILAAIEHERRVELFGEWAHRWLDLKRTGRADAVLSLVKSGWKSTSQLYPIPQDELLTNVSLIQNQGY